MTKSAESRIDGRYRVERELGRGAMGRVMLVTDTYAGDVPLACKVLEDASLAASFVAEFELLRLLSHPGFARAYDLGTDGAGGTLYATQELVEGPTLAQTDALDGADAPDAPPSAPLIDVAHALLRAVDHLHRLGYVHGDLAPANVVYQAGAPARVKILDSGAAGPTGSGAGTTSGVLKFAAPERLEGAPLSPQSDLWSLGALLFKAAHGTHPWPEHPVSAPADGKPVRDGEHPLDPLLDRLLDPDPACRHPSAAAALVELESLTGRALPLVPDADIVERVAGLPFVDGGGHLAELRERIEAARAGGRAALLRVSGAPGSGRSRLLEELAHGLAASGARVALERAHAQDHQGEALVRALARLGLEYEVEVERPAALVSALTTLARESEAPLALLVDDVHRGDETTREALEALARTISALPERSGRLIVALVGDGEGEVDEDSSAGRAALGPWRPKEVEAMLATLFPERRTGGRVAEPLAKASRGNPGVLRAVLGSLAEGGVLTVHASHVALSSLEDAALPRSLEEHAAAAIEALGEDMQRLAGLLAHSVEPLPLSAAGDEAMELVRAGVAATLPGEAGQTRLTLSSEAMAAAARSALDARDAHGELSLRWQALADESSAAMSAWLRHLIAAGVPKALERAADALPELEPHHAVPLLGPMMEAGWPTDAASALEGGAAADKAGRAELARDLLQRAVGLADDPGLSARARTRLGDLESRQARHPDAIRAFESALEIGGDALGEQDRAEVLAGLARCAVLSGSLDDAERWCREGLGLVSDEDPGLKGRLLYARGLLAWYRGDLQLASTKLQEALVDVREAGEQREEAAIVTALGLVAHRKEALDSAVEHYKEALRIGEEIGDDSRVLTALQNLGVAHHQQGAWTEALDTYHEALALAEALGQTGRVLQLAGNLGNLWRYLGELEEARSVCERGLALARREGNRFTEGVILTMLGEVALADEQWEEASELLEQAVGVTKGLDSPNEEIEAKLNLARLRLETRHYPGAIGAAERALEVAERSESKALAAQARSLLARAHRESVHGDPERASSLVEQSRADAEAIANPDGRWPVLLEASMSARDHGDLEEAARLADEVRQILVQLEDAVPAKHRDAFRGLRERRRARFETAIGRPAAARSAQPEEGDELRWTRLLEINKRLNSEHDVRRLLEYIMDSAILLTGAERGFLLLADEDEPQKLEVRVARNIDQENIKNTRFKISHSIARNVIASGEPIVTVDAMEDQRYREQLSVHALRLRSVLSLPMRGRERVIGAIYLDNRFRAAAFGRDEMQFMEAFADQAAIALGNARLMAAREKSQKALEKSQKEIEGLNKQLEAQLEERTQELEDTHKVVIRQQRQLEAKHQYDSIIGSSGPMRAVFSVMDRLLDNSIPVLIEGESGTGKELVARAIHFNGDRRTKPFVAVNCGAIPSNLLESELFGHMRGSFTGATSDKKGLFEAAHGGTLLLDELGELPLEMQVKLLRVLQSGEIKKVGATKEVKVDVRIIAATNRKLDEEVAEGRFREDLYYRLSVVPITLPPLRERKDDIPLLVRHFVEDNDKQGLGNVNGISPAALSLLQGYSWPGNVRQLEMVLKNASLFAEGEILEPRDFESFPDIVGDERAPLTSANLAGRTLSDIEREAIIAALIENRGNKKRSAEELGIDRRTLYNKLKAYKIVIEKELHVT